MPILPTITPVWLAEAYFPDWGWISVTASPRGVLSLGLLTGPSGLPQYPSDDDAPAGQEAVALTRAALTQVGEYLCRDRRGFDLPIDWSELQPFQRQVLQATLRIPYGQVRTYGQIAAEIQRPGAARAVGGALGRNPIPIVIPCHRVVDSAGHLHGFSAPGGLQTKARLLALEGCAVQANRTII